jgi:hypothetical protein
MRNGSFSNGETLGGAQMNTTKKAAYRSRARLSRAKPVENHAIAYKAFVRMPYDKRARWLRSHPLSRSLEKKLLAIAGEQVVLMPEPHAAPLVDRGCLYSPRGMRLVRGERHRCHSNAARLWAVQRKAGFQIVTGWALSGDVWFQHSWGLLHDRIIETTERCNAYFGVALDDTESLRFWFANDLERAVAQLPGILEMDAELRGIVDAIARGYDVKNSPSGSEKSLKKSPLQVTRTGVMRTATPRNAAKARKW